MNNTGSFILDRLQTVPIPARKLFAVIVRQAYHGPLRPKAKGTATQSEILEGCGLDVGEFYALLDMLQTAGLVRVQNSYPFEEVQISADAAEAEAIAERCKRENIPLETIFVNPVLPESENPETRSATGLQ